MSDCDRTSSGDSARGERQFRIADAFTRQNIEGFAGVNTAVAQYVATSLAPLSDISSTLAKSFAASFAPVNMAGWLPQLNLPDSSVLGINGLVEGLGHKLFEQFRPQWNDFFESMRGLAERVYPPNWAGVDHPDFDLIEVILLDEGIPLAWVPSQPVLGAIFNASDAASRRVIIGSRWKRITSDCEASLGEITHAGPRGHLPFAIDVVQAIRDGHASAAQALAANLLDSILRRSFDISEFGSITSHKNDARFDFESRQIRAAFTLAPVWRAYAEYWISRGDSIPRTFGRHPSAHAVSKIQYSRVNAVTGLMLVTSVLRLLDGELDR